MVDEVMEKVVLVEMCSGKWPASCTSTYRLWVPLAVFAWKASRRKSHPWSRDGEVDTCKACLVLHRWCCWGFGDVVEGGGYGVETGYRQYRGRGLGVGGRRVADSGLDQTTASMEVEE